MHSQFLLATQVTKHSSGVRAGDPYWISKNGITETEDKLKCKHLIEIKLKSILLCCVYRVVYICRYMTNWDSLIANNEYIYIVNL